MRALHRLSILCAVAVFSMPVGLAAQKTPVVFVHGFLSNGSTWDSASSRLQSQLAIQPYRPTLTWQDRYDDQAPQLQSALSSVPPSVIAVGHSNGGIVSRQWSRLRPVSGIVTMSTPHVGAPVARNAPLFVAYNFQVFGKMQDITNAWGAFEHPFTWVLWELKDTLEGSVQIGYDSILMLSGSLGIDTSLPVWDQMKPASSYLLDLNSSTNKAREAANIPTRVAMVNQAKNFYLGGVFRAVFPDIADGIGNGMHIGASLLDYYAMYLYTRGVEDFDNYERAEALWSLAAWLGAHEEAWCQTVSDPTPFVLTSAGICWENDSIVPTFAQVYPGGISLQRRDTAVHMRLKQDQAAQDGLYQILTTYAQVPPISAPPPPPTTTDNKLTSGEKLLVNQKLVSADSRYRLTYQGDGNLVLRYSDGTPLWSSKTAGTTPNYTTMQGDGNAVVRNASSTAVWNSGTSGNPGAYVVSKNDGNVVIVSSSGAQLWQTGTAGKTGSSSGSSATGSTGVLPSGGVLNPGQSITSSDGRFKLSYQGDGNLVLYKIGVGPLWATGTTSAGKTRMQTDGNLVVYNAAGTPVWASQTAGNSGAYLRVQNDGNLVIYRSNGTPIWASGTRG
jgi:pimeloyl-ACP methyl ester carboxylesterase